MYFTENSATDFAKFKSINNRRFCDQIEKHKNFRMKN